MEILLTATVFILAIWSYVQIRSLRRELRRTREQLHQNGREQKLLSAYANIEDLFDSFEEFVRETRGELERDRRELMELSRQATAIYVRVIEQEPLVYTPPPPLPEPPPPVMAEEPAKPKAAAKPKTSAAKPKAAPPAQAMPGETAAHRILTAENRESLQRFANKNQKIRYLLTLGLSQGDVARELDIGVGEVRLVAATLQE
jgi:Mg2+ and Co2+ transporter CorA